jgi:hypothetical protein
MLRQGIGRLRSLSTSSLAPAIAGDAEALFDVGRSWFARRAEVAPNRAVVDSECRRCDVGGILPGLLLHVVADLGIETDALAVTAPRGVEAVERH